MLVRPFVKRSGPFLRGERSRASLGRSGARTGCESVCLFQGKAESFKGRLNLSRQASAFEVLYLRPMFRTNGQILGFAWQARDVQPFHNQPCHHHICRLPAWFPPIRLPGHPRRPSSMFCHNGNVAKLAVTHATAPHWGPNHEP